MRPMSSNGPATTAINREMFVIPLPHSRGTGHQSKRVNMQTARLICGSNLFAMRKLAPTTTRIPAIVCQVCRAARGPAFPRFTLSYSEVEDLLDRRGLGIA